MKVEIKRVDPDVTISLTHAEAICLGILVGGQSLLDAQHLYQRSMSDAKEAVGADALYRLSSGLFEALDDVLGGIL